MALSTLKCMDPTPLQIKGLKQLFEAKSIHSHNMAQSSTSET